MVLEYPTEHERAQRDGVKSAEYFELTRLLIDDNGNCRLATEGIAA